MITGTENNYDLVLRTGAWDRDIFIPRALAGIITGGIGAAAVADTDSDEAGNRIAKNVKAALIYYSGGGEMIVENDEVIDIVGSEDLEIPVEVEFRDVAITPEQVKKYKLTGYQLEAFLTTDKRIKEFKKILLDAIDDCWDESIYDDKQKQQ